MLFQNFPITYFEVGPNKEQVIIQDFLRAVKIDPILKENDTLFTIYMANDGETPEIISHKSYKTTQYHWVIMLVNEKFDPWRDFPQRDSIVRQIAMETYDDINAVHHYVDENNNIVDELHDGKIPISNIEYEMRKNEDKRVIKIPRLDVVKQFVSQYNSLISV